MHAFDALTLYIKGVCRNCNILIFISEVKNNNCYEIKTGQQYSVDILILIRIYLHENVGRIGADFYL